MKKQKLSLEELKVESFITQKGNLQAKGGITPATTVVSRFISAAFNAGVAAGQQLAKASDACPEFSEALDCTFSA